MSPTLSAFLRSWPSAPWLSLALLGSAGIYLRGWLRLRHRDPLRWQPWRLASFWGGLATIYLALASPIEPFASLFLQLHMLQHLLLMMVAPPLIWLAWPLLPMIHGLPEPIRINWVAPALRTRWLRRGLAWITHPQRAWIVFVATTWTWHVPALYDLALQNDRWHVVQHACFVMAALIFWHPVVRPFPSRPRWSTWLLFPYLLLADVQNTVLAAILSFHTNVLYAHYEQVPRVGGISALEDQARAGALMWVPGSIAFLIPLLMIGVAQLRGAAQRVIPRVIHASAVPPTFDVLRIPLVGPFLRWRGGRTTLQVAALALAVLVICDGLWGPQISPLNLAGVLPWIHWRGILILGLLVAGNVFCLACPLTLPRRLARHWFPGGRPWPRWLRHKWLTVVLVALFFWSYEAFSLWDSPWLTAWIASSYFAAAFVVDSLFRDGSFCKYVCPIGQFNFVQSLMSPLEIGVRQPDVCLSCQSKECIRGSSQVPGCSLQLYVPRKQGNFDCTFCLDCVQACPHANVGLLAAVPGRILWQDRWRLGIGRLGRRLDVAVLVLVLVSCAFANAAGMVGPVVHFQSQVQLLMGSPSRVWITSLSYGLAAVLLPSLAVGVTAMVSCRWSQSAETWLASATRYALALAPIGFGMWLAHYSFHFLTSAGSAIPAAQRFAADAGWSGWGDPVWRGACCGQVATWIPHLEILMLDVGLLVSWYAAFRLSERSDNNMSLTLRAFVPWGCLILGFFALGVWIVYQPMEMRGTLPAPVAQAAGLGGPAVPVLSSPLGVGMGMSGPLPLGNLMRRPV